MNNPFKTLYEHLKEKFCEHEYVPIAQLGTVIFKKCLKCGKVEIERK